MTMGQRLAMKHTISEPPKNKASTTNRQSYEIKWPPWLSGKNTQKSETILMQNLDFSYVLFHPGETSMMEYNRAKSILFGK